MGVRPAGHLGPALSHAQGQSSSPGRPFPGIRCHFLPPSPPGQGLVTVLPYLPWGLGCPSRFQGPSSRLCRETVCSLPAHPF